MDSLLFTVFCVYYYSVATVKKLTVNCIMYNMLEFICEAQEYMVM